MSITEEIQKLIATEAKGENKAQKAKHEQLQSLEEVEKTLANLGVTLEPKFDVSLNSRFVFCDRPK